MLCSNKSWPMLRRAINCTEELVQLSNTATAYPNNAKQLRNTLNKIHELKVRTVKETRTQQKDKVSLEFFSETHANLSYLLGIHTMSGPLKITKSFNVTVSWKMNLGLH